MLALVFIFGLCLGSFLNVVILRLKSGESLMGRSQCPKCHKQLAWYHNLPLLSFAWLRGRCAFCHEPISWQYPLVEAASALIWLFGYLKFGTSGWLDVVAFGIFGSFLLALFVFDLRWYELPDELTLTGIAVALVINFGRGYAPIELLASTGAGALFFAFQYFVSRGRWVGDGDIRLGAMIGAMAGTYLGLGVALMLAYAAGSVFGLAFVVLRRRSLQSQLPFGAFLAPAAVAALIWAGELWQWYSGLLW